MSQKSGKQGPIRRGPMIEYAFRVFFQVPKIGENLIAKGEKSMNAVKVNVRENHLIDLDGEQNVSKDWD